MMMRVTVCILALHVLFAGNLHSQVVKIKSNVPLASQFVADNTTYIIQSPIDMNGNTIIIPPHSRLLFKRKGRVINGVLVGNESKLEGRRSHYIGVKCEGTWVIPIISDTMFDRTALSDNQIMRNIEALQSDNVENVITLSSSEYSISIEERSGSGLSLKSHTTLINRSTIRLKPNSWSHYSILSIANAQEVTIQGGTIIGDLEKHMFVDGTISSWGHGLNISESKDILVDDVRIEKCIGDGIAITGGREDELGKYDKASKNVRIVNSVMDSNRRQGMSIIHAENVTVQKCVFSSTGAVLATPPSAGLDIEPNAYDGYKQGVRDVIVTNCRAFGNTGGGIKVQGYLVVGTSKSVENIIIEQSEVDGSVDIASDGVVVKNSHMRNSVVRGGRDEIGKVEFDGCAWEDGSGILVYYSGYQDAKGNREGGVVDTLIIRNSIISIAQNQSDEFYKGAVAFHGGVGGVNHLMCENTEITVPNTAGPKYNLTKSNNIPDLQFNNCTIRMPERLLYTRGARFNNCRIECKEIDLKETDRRFKDHFQTCTILK